MTTAKRPSGLFARLKAGLARTRDGFSQLFLGKKAIDAELLEQLEERLLLADAGIAVTEQVLQALQKKISRQELDDSDALAQALREALQQLLIQYAQPLRIDDAIKPFVILVVGVNGAGKTTTIGKLAKRLQAEGKSVLLAAGDTFRAAAIEQLQTWGARENIPVIAQAHGADSAAVIFDAIQAAKARNIDVVIADTAGRLHTQNHLMEELKKVTRVIQKAIPEAPHETLLVLDAGLGQNALQQAKIFHQAVAVTGIALTKLDGTAKGGIIFAITEALHLPVRFIGVGEAAEDLQLFEPETFVSALLNQES